MGRPPDRVKLKLPKRGRLLGRAFDRAAKRRGAPGADVSSDEFMLELVAEVGVLAGRKLDRLSRELAEVREAVAALAGPVPREMLRSELVRMDPAEFEVRLARRRPPARVNGHSSHGDGVAPSQPESWHPESPFNPESYS